MVLYNYLYNNENNVVHTLYHIPINIQYKYKNIFQKAAISFNNVLPTYHVELLDTPTMVWDFNLLLTVVRTMFYLLLTDKKTPLRLYKHCQEPFIASRPSAVFCSPACKNRYNVYKSRGRNKGEE